MPGWLRLHRKLQQSEVWNLDPFSCGQAWVDLLMSANYKQGTILVRGVFIEVKRGQVGVSEYTLAERWKWSRGKVRRFLEWLEKSGQVVLQKNNVTTLISIAKYDEYQSDSTADDTANDTADGLQMILQTDTTKKNKEGEEGNSTSTGVDPSAPDDSTKDNGVPKGLLRLIEIWNQIPGVQPCRLPTPKRIAAFRQRAKSETWMNSVKPAIQRVRESLFCTGHNDRQWIADIDWFLKPDTVVRILEGKYDNRDLPTPLETKAHPSSFKDFAAAFGGSNGTH